MFSEDLFIQSSMYFPSLYLLSQNLPGLEVVVNKKPPLEPVIGQHFDLSKTFAGPYNNIVQPSLWCPLLLVMFLVGQSYRSIAILLPDHFSFLLLTVLNMSL